VLDGGRVDVGGGGGLCVIVRGMFLVYGESRKYAETACKK